MDTIQIPCPKCGRELKLRDRNLLGRKGKCPKCGHAFVMEEPVVPLELAEPEPMAVGRWVPESGLATAPRPVTTPAPAAAVQEAPLFPTFPTAGATDGAAARLKALQKKNARRRNVGLIVGTVIILAVCGVTYFAVTNQPGKTIAANQPDEHIAQPEVGAANPDAEDTAEGLGEYSNESPTKGEKIELQYMPFGPQIVLNIRPAELWQKESLGEELRFCLTPLAKLLEDRFQEYFHRKPEEIEEAQICLIPGQQGTLPEVAAVVHLVEEAKKSRLLEDIGGQIVNDYDYPVYINGDRAYLIADQKTVAMCPKDSVKEMVDAIDGRNPAADGIDELLPMTDRDRHITLVFVPRTIRLHASWWFPENLKPLALKACDWFGDEVESATWSFHLGDDKFYSDMHLRTVSGITSANLGRQTRTKLGELPQELLETVRAMNPREVGKRKVIGRLPKMTEAFAMASVVTTGTRHVQVITPLPDRAAPNLALGSLLAWDESTRTDFTKERPKNSTEDAKLPDKLADRLKLKLDVDFKNAPLQEVIAFISTEIKTTIDIDGDALKAGGFTKNLKQDLQGDKMTAEEAIARIISKYQDPDKPSNTMVIVLDEGKKTITLTTLGFCEQKKLTPYDILKK